MTESELRSHPGFIEMCTENVNFGLLISFFEQNCPFLGKNITDPTSIVRNEGAIQGYYDVLRKMRGIHVAPKTQPPPSNEPSRLYPNPDQINQDNLKHNRPPKKS